MNHKYFLLILLLIIPVYPVLSQDYSGVQVDERTETIRHNLPKVLSTPTPKITARITATPTPTPTARVKENEPEMLDRGEIYYSQDVLRNIL